jgi:ketosteroid isomerase-like protein
MEPRQSDPVEIVRSVIAALNRGDIDQVLSYCDRDIVLWAPGPDLTGQHVNGVEELRDLLQRAEESWPDAWTSIDSIIGSGDRVAVEMTTVATESGIPLRQPMAAFYTLRGGLIVEQRSYYDLKALEQRLNG